MDNLYEDDSIESLSPLEHITKSSNIKYKPGNFIGNQKLNKNYLQNKGVHFG